MHTEDQLLI